MLVRSNTAAWWTSNNPVLALDDIGEEFDTGRNKVGDGSTAWNDLDYSYLTPGAADLYNQVVEDDGTPVTQRASVNFTGAGVSVADTGGKTTVTIAGGAGEAFPVGSVFIAFIADNPNTLLGYGTWSAFAAGRVLVGFDAGNPAFDVVEEVGGEQTHTLTSAEMPTHTHVQDSHNHTQDAHGHNVTDPGHVHVEQNNSATTGGLAGWAARDTSTNTAVATGYSTQSATTGLTVDTAVATNQAAVAVNQNTGGGGPHNNLQPYIVVYMWKRTA